MARIDNLKKVVYLSGKEDIDESLKVAQLLSLGYTAQPEPVEKPKRKRKSNVKTKKFYDEALNAEQKKAFEKTAKEKGFVAAAHEANVALGLEKPKADAE